MLIFPYKPNEMLSCVLVFFLQPCFRVNSDLGVYDVRQDLSLILGDGVGKLHLEVAKQGNKGTAACFYFGEAMEGQEGVEGGGWKLALKSVSAAAR